MSSSPITPPAARSLAVDCRRVARDDVSAGDRARHFAREGGVLQIRPPRRAVRSGAACNDSSGPSGGRQLPTPSPRRAPGSRRGAALDSGLPAAYGPEEPMWTLAVIDLDGSRVVSTRAELVEVLEQRHAG